MKLINCTTGTVIADDVRQAHNFWTRFKGLMFKRDMNRHAALHLSPCSSIHTFFMKFGIDVIYINRENEVVGIERHLTPGKIGGRFKKARSVIELPAGTLGNKVSTGDTLGFAEKIPQCNPEARH
ncbi:DUF192 domain-containing protein [Salinicoccus halitifaciens]|uniref:Uncharacterized membrane protein (UPF0127 family) n=1 Tax=Salinicoccus halitifaciens TaxID=1073415 RepID=A0ABV2E9Y1_9STAP|nr:DUF192 domain-containing protein [Salinicoccus halitifaciens]MCD2137998.1 DUF192 domain-containing protein [Salinicoccus halitifaciens]